MIVLFTANLGGGIPQFAIQMLRELTDLQYDVRCFVPEETTVTVPAGLAALVVRYKKIKTLHKHHPLIIGIGEEILSLNPDLVWYFDDTVLSFQTILRLKNRVRQMLTIHDAGRSHPVWKRSLRNRLKRGYEDRLRKRCADAVENILVLSEESRKDYLALHPKHSDKVLTLILGAHVPDVTPQRPQELSDQAAGYFLFFGRIDKYKGIGQMLESYGRVGDITRRLVIAGKGLYTDHETGLCRGDGRIFCMNRYIDDGEMIWLFQHARAVILPYIEATQSGVVPIAYRFGIPVITSDVRGLTQFVDDGETGIICRSSDDYVNAYRLLEDDAAAARMSRCCQEYYRIRLDWKKNLQELLVSLRNGYEGSDAELS